jgi:hypothetical protein
VDNSGNYGININLSFIDGYTLPPLAIETRNLEIIQAVFKISDIDFISADDLG